MVDIGAAMGRALPALLMWAAVVLLVYCSEHVYRATYVASLLAFAVLVAISATVRMAVQAQQA